MSNNKIPVKVIKDNLKEKVENIETIIADISFDVVYNEDTEAYKDDKDDKNNRNFKINNLKIDIINNEKDNLLDSKSLISLLSDTPTKNNKYKTYKAPLIYIFKNIYNNIRLENEIEPSQFFGFFNKE